MWALATILKTQYIYLHKKSQTVKKGAAHAKKAARKSCEIKGGGPEVAVVV